ncbi:MAG: YggS family pyridoxal phosphate-dependent enzyme [Candidatus Muirbacterium halophilum]|nr:YggS family pyridoxal phosphate-dependent enzyme [Candidatus Muirbacterium halophilum]MCK9475368.1 YggS family pyridoxal phosphate-dependent enzyme [Candidatus Muirbacterium halophilum]
MSIKNNISEIKKSISEVSESKITLVTVTKYATTEKIMEAYECGERNFGESYVNQLIQRAEEYPQDILWHMIGHIQTNKVKYLAKINNLELIHSIDSIRLVEEIEKRFDRTINGLVQINLSNEDSKSGIYPDEVESFFYKLDNMKLEKLNITGLMTISPLKGNAEDKAKCFMKLRLLKEKINKNLKNCRLNPLELSMGMTDDYELAIKEGSSIVRIGSLIFN